MPAGTLDSLQDLCELKRVSVTLPAECGGHTYWLRELGAEDLMQLADSYGTLADMGSKRFQAHVLRLSLINEDGSPMFPALADLSKEDAVKLADEQVNKLLRLKWKAFRLLALEALKISGVATLVTSEGEEKN